MVTEKQIEIAQKLLSNNLVNKVFHSVELVEDDKGVKYPAYKVGNEQYYVGPDDTKQMFAYIRTNGAARVSNTTLEGSCSKMYTMNVPTRVVIFQDHNKEDFDALIRRMLVVGFLKDVDLVGYNNNSFQLGKQESQIGKFAFDSTTFYLAIDLIIKVNLRGSECESDKCIVYPNPIML